VREGLGISRPELTQRLTAQQLKQNAEQQERDHPDGQDQAETDPHDSQHRVLKNCRR
jgi:hypothetical protein